MFMLWVWKAGLAVRVFAAFPEDLSSVPSTHNLLQIQIQGPK